MRTSIKYSQNFLQSQSLIRDLISKSGITKYDTVYEIGAGQGILTAELVKVSRNVVAFELDQNLFNKLQERFQGKDKLELNRVNFLSHPLPNFSYKVFSNIPFNITSAIIKKLTLEENAPADSYLVVQKEAAKKFMGRPLDDKNSQISTILYPWFLFNVVYEFKRSDFSPRPNIDTILLQIKKRNVPLLDVSQRSIYEDFITYSFNQTKPNIAEGLVDIFGSEFMHKSARNFGFSPRSKPSELDFRNWIDLFKVFLTIPQNKYNKVKGSFAKLIKQQENIEKINRTRIDKDWKKYSTQK
jgi:23S rRNA (adenine-N6)-dimethyltransferase